jgi:hypothetical protein
MKTSFSLRPIVVLDFKDTEIEILHPQFSVLAGDNSASNGKRYLDFGSLCYLRRRVPIRNSQKTYVGSEVDVSSLENHRLLLTRNLIEIARHKQNFTTALHLFTTTKIFIDWMDDHENKYSHGKIESMKEAYRDYTHYLLHKINSSGIRGNPLKQATASSRQTAARIVVTIATGLHEKEVTALATYIPRRHNLDHINLKQPNSDIQAKTFSSLVNFIEEAHRLLVDGGEFPMSLASPGNEPHFLYSYNQTTKKSNNAEFSINRMLNSCPKFPTWDIVTKHFNLSGNSSALKRERSNYDTAKIANKRKNLELRCELRLQVGNHAMCAGMLAFIAATGANNSIVQTLEMDSSEIVPSTQGQRFSGTKARANGKTVYPEFGVQFVPVFKKILELRAWVLNGRKSDLVFMVAPQNSSSISFIGQCNLTLFKNLLKKCQPATKWIAPRQWRKNVSYQYIGISGGDFQLTAEKLGNTERTLQINYSRPALEEFAAQMSGFFDAMYSAAVDRTRTLESIPVLITDIKQPGTVTGIGSCENGSKVEPQRAPGFTQMAPKPSCGDPETCLFCTFYAVHADDDDIRRLLSLRYLITAINGQQPHDHWITKFGPTIHRLDEVLIAIKEKNSTAEETITRIRNEVESGALDPFWAIHFDTLVYVGAVS